MANLDRRSVVLITGASAGIGRQLAKLFAADGRDLVLVARRRERLDELAKQLEGEFRISVTVFADDLRDPQCPQRIAQMVEENGYEVGVLVNNAGFGWLGPFIEATDNTVTDMLTVNMTALVRLTQLLLPPMIARGHGRILNMGSLAGFLPGPYMAVYYATKAFVNSFSQALSEELKGTGVTVTVSCPGPTATEFGAVAGSDARKLAAARSMPVEQVALHAYDALKHAVPVAIPGFQNRVALVLVRWLPRGVVRRITARLNRAVKRD